MAFHHDPVMVNEIVEVFRPVPAGVLVDANLGGGGHAEALLSAHAGLRLIGFDRDGDAVDAATARLAPFGARASLHHRPFEAMTDVVEAEGHGADVSGVLFDLGLSSPQVDRPDRGFSFHEDGPLDMRFDQSGGPTAADIVNERTQSEIEDLLRINADERHARLIARAVVESRPLRTTLELVEVVASAVPAAYRRQGHPARRTFQALRMAVNDELSRLRAALLQAISLLREGGRLAVLAYHSGEDRIVKEMLREASTGGCTCPPDLPCACGATPSVRLLRPLSRTPSDDELAINPRSRSARLRAAEKHTTTDVAAHPTPSTAATTGTASATTGAC
jgi:16S rRNA (cytosine1402-N4)-methyltransferase